ncbi:uncharacterized protein [Garra rufa]|uniref:uncharacterized protein n=1 Tax=Garra rufa TaxID=137080 RepID=UPI003CCEE9BE
MEKGLGVVAKKLMTRLFCTRFFNQETVSVGLDLLKDPVTIPCGHSYCMSCITDCWNQDDLKGVYSCPQCRQTFTPRPALNKNTMLTEVVEQLKKTKLQAAVPAGPEDVECDVCTVRKHKAVKSCLACLNSYCQNHLQQHENFFKGKRHNLIDATGRLQEMICPNHNKKLEIYCHTDQQCICYLCTMDNHKNHDTVAAVAERTAKQVVLEKRKGKFQLRIQQREKDLKKLREAVETHKHSAQTAVQDSERIFTELIHSIEKIRSEVTQWIRDKEKAAVSQAEGLMYQMEQQIDDLKRKHEELDQFSKTDDYIYFLQNFQSLAVSPESTDTSSITLSSLLSFDNVGKSISQLKEKLEDLCREKIKKIYGGGVFFSLASDIREEFLQYYSQFTLDPNTVNEELCLSEENRVVTSTDRVQKYPDHPERFDSLLQVLCTESVCGRCYWELEWSGSGGVGIAVSYKRISRKGWKKNSLFGGNDQSWCLDCSSSRCSFSHNGNHTKLPVRFNGCRIGVFVDHSAGTLSFYSVSDTMSLIHKVQTTFTQPLYPGFVVYDQSTVKLCDLTLTLTDLHMTRLTGNDNKLKAKLLSTVKACIETRHPDFLGDHQQTSSFECSCSECAGTTVSETLEFLVLVLLVMRFDVTSSMCKLEDRLDVPEQFSLSSSAVTETAVADSEKIFTELICSIERSRSKLMQMIREKEKAAVSQAEGVMEQLDEMAEVNFSQDQFSCPVCLDLLKDPVAIPCGHSYCMSCITDCWNQDDLKGVYSCPQCRQTFTPRPALNKNTILAEVVEQLKKTKLQAAVPAGPEDVESNVCTRRKHKSFKSCLTFSKKQQRKSQHRKKDLDELREAVKSHKVDLEERKRKFQQRIQQREKDLEHLGEAVECHMRSAQTAVEDNERIFIELMCSIEEICSEMTRRIRDQEKTAVSRAEGLMEQLEQDTDDLKRRCAELEQISQIHDHTNFLKSFQSLAVSPESTDVPDVTVSSLLSFDNVGRSLSQLKEKLLYFCREEIDMISGRATYVEIIPTNEPKVRKEFLQYYSQFTLDPNTVNKNLCLSEENRVVTFTAGVQQYPDHSERFHYYPQVLCREGVCGRCYWELEWSGSGFVCISVSYIYVNRKGQTNECVFGYNDQSWSLICSTSRCSFSHDDNHTELPVRFDGCRIGVYVDHSAGTLSFYSVSDTMSLIHKVQTTFTHPLYPGFAVINGSAVKLCGP